MISKASQEASTFYYVLVHAERSTQKARMPLCKNSQNGERGNESHCGMVETLMIAASLLWGNVGANQRAKMIHITSTNSYRYSSIILEYRHIWNGFRLGLRWFACLYVNDSFLSSFFVPGLVCRCRQTHNISFYSPGSATKNGISLTKRNERMW